MSIYCSRYEKDADTFVKVSTDFIDNLLPVLNGSELKVLLFLAKWQKSNRVADANYAYIEQGAGLSRPAVKQAINVLKRLGLIRKAEGRGYLVVARDTEEFGLDLEVKKVYQERGYKKFTQPGIESVPQRVKKTYTKQERPSDLKRREQEALGTALEEGKVVPLFVQSSAQQQELELAEAYIRAGETLKAEEALAQLKKNTVTKKSYYRKPLPISYLPQGAPAKDYNVFCQISLLKATNIIATCLTDHGLSPQNAAPNNVAELNGFGDVISNFLSHSDWTLHFRRFFNWVLDNKDKHPFSLLSYYYADWVASDAVGNFG